MATKKDKAEAKKKAALAKLKKDTAEAKAGKKPTLKVKTSPQAPAKPKAKPKFKLKAGEFPAYIIKFDDQPTLNGRQRVETFVNGHAVLDKIALMTTRPGDFAQYDEANRSIVALIKPETMAEFAEYWEARGATVTQVTEAEAAAYRTKLETDPKGHLKELVEDAPGAADGDGPPSGDKVDATGKDTPGAGKKEETKTDAPPHESMNK